MPELQRYEDTVYFEVKGDGPDAIVLLHNLMADREIWAAQVAHLRDRFRVISVDIRGHGKSTARVPYTVRDATLDVRAILDSLALERAIFAGVSIGASICMELAILHPECVRGMALLSACATASTRMDGLRNTVFAETVKTFGMKRELARQVSGYLFGKSFAAESPDLVHAWETKICALVPLFASHALRAWNKRERVLERLPALTVPTLVVVGDEDIANPPSFGEEIVHHMKTARLARIARAGHTSPVERPDEVCRILDEFATSLSASPP